jgi:hypothetical protein
MRSTEQKLIIEHKRVKFTFRKIMQDKRIPNANTVTLARQLDIQWTSQEERMDL